MSGNQTQERDVNLVFDDDKLTVRTRDGKQVYHEILYSAISKFAYEETALPKVVANAGGKAGEEKRHWLTIYYQEGGKPATVLLSLDTEEYGQALAIASMVTQKDVEGAP